MFSAVACLAVVVGVGEALFAHQTPEEVRNANWKFADPVVEAVANGEDSATVEEIASCETVDVPVAPDYGIAYDDEGNPYADKDLLVVLDGALDERGLASLMEREGVRMTYAGLVSKSLDDNGVLVEVCYEGSRAPQELGDSLVDNASVREAELNYLQQACEVEAGGVGQRVPSPHESEQDGNDSLVEEMDKPTNDQNLSQQWELEAVGAFEAWDISKSNNNVTVAMIDTGVMCEHEDLAANVVTKFAYNSNSRSTGAAAVSDVKGHGTHVSGIVAAVANNGKGTAGVSYNANVLPIRAWKNAESAKNSDIIKGIDYVTELKKGNSWPSSYGPIRVINMSLGGYTKSSNYQSAITRAYNAGILVVASAGNDSTDDAHYPSAYDHVLAVSALEEDGKSGTFDSSYSNYGSYVDLSAPGSSVYSTTDDGAYYYKTGTSMATPVVSGAAALVAATNPSLSPDEIESVLESTADDKGSSGWDQFYGHGALRLDAAVKRVTPYTLISAADVSGIELGGYAYTGSAIKPVPVIKYKGKVLVEGVDYSIDYSDNVKVGTGKITLRGKGDFRGWHSVPFAITKASIAGADIAAIPDQVYARDERRPEPVVSFNGAKLVRGTDYDVAYEDNENAGTAKVIVRGKGNFAGERSASFTIAPASMTSVKADKVADQVYSGAPLEPNLPFFFNGSYLVKGDDYDIVACDGNIDVGTATVTVRGKGNFAGERAISFAILSADISSVEYAAPSRVYTGAAQEPEPKLTCNGTALVKGDDYDVVRYEDNIDVGTARVIVKGKGNFTGEHGFPFDIRCADLAGADIAAIPNQVYTGAPQEPAPSFSFNKAALVEGVDYDIVSYGDNVVVGTARVIVRGKGNFDGECTVPFAVTCADISKVDVGKIPNQVYTGTGREAVPSFSFNGAELFEGIDYDIASYGDNVNVGTAMVTVHGKGNFTDARATTFVISKADILSVDVAAIPEQVFTGGERRPEPILSFNGVPLAKGVDYDVVSYGRNVMPGTGQVFVRGTGAFVGERVIAFAISKASISGGDVAMIPDQAYTGAEQTPMPSLTLGGTELVAGTDYDVSYDVNVNAGMAKVTLKGKGAYSGTVQASFKIVKAAQPMKVKGKKKTVAHAKVAKAKLTLKKAVKFTKKAQGRVTYKKVAKGSSKRLMVKKNGRIVVKKGTAPGLYKIKVRVTAAGNDNYEKGSRTVVVKVRVKATGNLKATAKAPAATKGLVAASIA